MRQRWIGLTIATIAVAVLAAAGPRPAIATTDIEIVRDYRDGLAQGDLIRTGGPTAERLRAAPPENRAGRFRTTGLPVADKAVRPDFIRCESFAR